MPPGRQALVLCAILVLCATMVVVAARNHREPLAGRDLELGTRIDLTEVRRPYTPAGPATTAAGLFLLLLGRLKSPRRDRVRRLEESEELFHGIFDRALDGIVLVDRETSRFAKFNKQAHENLGYTRDEFARLTMADIELEGSPENGGAQPQRVTTLGGDFRETRHRHKDGSIRQVLVAAATVSAGGRDYLISTHRDITKRRRAEQGLRQSEAKYRRLIENLPESYFVYQHGADGVFTYVSRSVTKVLGYSVDEYLTHYSKYLTDNPTNREVARYTDLGLRCEKQPAYEIEVYHKDGSVRTLEVQEIPVCDEHGTIVELEGISRDVTQKKRAEEALRFAQFAVDHNAIATFWVHSDGRISYVNDAACRALGYSYDELTSMTVPDIDSDFSEAAWPAHWEEMKAAGSLSFESHHRTKDGRTFPVEIVSTYLQYRDGEFICAYVRDITERKRLEEEQNKLYRAVEQSPVMILITDTDGNIEYVNPAFSEVTGYSLAEVVGENPRILRSGDKPSEGYNKLWDTITSGREWRGEFRNKKKNGELYWALASISPVRNSSGAITHFLDIAEDITESKRREEDLRRAEADLRLLNVTLERRVAHRTADLQAANRELEAFAHSVSHDLKAPLISIDGFTKIIEEDHAHRLDDDGKRVLDVIRKNVSKMALLIQDLLALSQAGRHSLRQSTIDIAGLVESVFEELKAHAADRDIRLDIGSLRPIHGDLTLIQQLFTNLLCNAVKFTTGKEIARIEVGCEEQGDEVVYFVGDNGAGFDMAYVDKLFGAFERLHYQDEFPGTGVGLAIVRRIAARHGGRVWAEGEVNEGATFYFAIPRTADDEP